MSLNFYSRSISILGSLYVMILGFLGGATYLLSTIGKIDQWFISMSFGSIAIIAFVILALQFLISPWLMDLQLSWIYDMDWVTLDELPMGMRTAIQLTQQKYGFHVGKIGIIHDGMPNAFTYGRFRNGARIVVTQGIIDLLDEDEQAAVIQHELGHIVNYDFIFMTLASAVPLLFYFVYRNSRTFTQEIGKSGDGDASKFAIAVGIVAVIAYLSYILSNFIVLLLSRFREHAADIFSAHETRKPGALSSSLVKIAYGLVLNDQKVDEELKNEDLEKDRRKTLKNRQGYGNALSVMGLADVNLSKSLVMQASSGNNEVTPDTVAKAATWDLMTPWAKFIELQSTHPLTGKRLLTLDRVAEEMELPRKYPDLGTTSVPESLWDEFLVDLFVGYILPLLFLILPAVSYLVSLNTSYSATTLVGASFIILAGLWYWRITIKYPRSIHGYEDPMRTPNTVMEGISSLERDGYIESSPVRGKPILIEGIVGGRGQPGFILSEDFMVRDDTGLIVIDYNSIIPFYNLWFGYKHVKGMMGEKVRVVGWYHRGVMPYIQLFRLYRENGKVKANRWRGLNLLFAALVFGIGVIILQGM